MGKTVTGPLKIFLRCVYGGFHYWGDINAELVLVHVLDWKNYLPFSHTLSAGFMGSIGGEGVMKTVPGFGIQQFLFLKSWNRR